MFQGNANLRSHNESHNYTPEQIAEIQRCIEDPEYFLRTYMRIVSLDQERLIPFDMRDYQVKMLDIVINNRFSLARWPRQSGKTTIVAGIMLWHVMFFSNYRVLVVANKHERARDILASIQQAYELMPKWLQPGVRQWAKGSIELGNGSMIRTAGTSGSAGRGGSFTMIYLDEYAHVPTHIAKDFFESVVPTISSGKSTKIVVTSTPRGLNAFYNLYKGAIDGTNGYVALDVKWNEVPGRDDKFRDQIVKAHGQRYFDQEFACEFIGSSYTLISAAKLLALTYDKPLFEDETIRVYAPPARGRNYVIAADVAEGVLGDYSAAVVFDVSALPYEVVCVYQCNDISTMAYPQVLLNLGKSYNDALIMVDATGIGDGVAAALFEDLEYEAVGTTAPSGAMARAAMAAGLMAKSRFGIKLDTRNRSTGCANLKALVEGDQLIVRDEKLVDELRRFSLNGKKYEAEEGHDDLVMCAVIFAWMSDQGYLKDLSSTDSRAAVLKREAARVEEEQLPVGMRWDGQHPVELEGMAAAVDSLDAFDKLLMDDDSGKTADPWIMDIVNKHFPD